MARRIVASENRKGERQAELALHLDRFGKKMQQHIPKEAPAANAARTISTRRSHPSRRTIEEGPIS